VSSYLLPRLRFVCRIYGACPSFAAPPHVSPLPLFVSNNRSHGDVQPFSRPFLSFFARIFLLDSQSFIRPRNSRAFPASPPPPFLLRILFVSAAPHAWVDITLPSKLTLRFFSPSEHPSDLLHFPSLLYVLHCHLQPSFFLSLNTFLLLLTMTISITRHHGPPVPGVPSLSVFPLVLAHHLLPLPFGYSTLHANDCL